MYSSTGCAQTLCVPEETGQATCSHRIMTLTMSHASDKARIQTSVCISLAFFATDPVHT